MSTCPGPPPELEQLAGDYDSHDTQRGDGARLVGRAASRWPPRSLRLPAEVISQLKLQARARHVRYTAYVRSILERAASETPPPDMADITERLERIERAVTGGHKTA